MGGSPARCADSPNHQSVDATLLVLCSFKPTSFQDPNLPEAEANKERQSIAVELQL